MKIIIELSSVADPYHFDADPDPRIRFRDDGSEVTFDSGILFSLLNVMQGHVKCKYIIHLRTILIYLFHGFG